MTYTGSSTIGATGPSGGSTTKVGPAWTNWFDENFGYKYVKTSTGKLKLVYTNPSGLGEQLGTAPIQGATTWFLGGKSPIGGLPLAKTTTADQAMYLFTHASASQLAATQQKLYFAGLYPKGYIPNLGVFTKKDKDAFRAMLVGLASSPDQGGLPDYLDAIGQAGQGSGMTVRHEAVPPLTITLTNPDDIKKVAQQAAQTLNGTYLDDASLNNFVMAYHQQQTDAQTQAYHQQYDPNAVTHPTDTETVIGGYGPGGTTTNPATGAGLEQELEDRIRAEHPNEVASNSFTAHLDTILSALRTPGAAR